MKPNESTSKKSQETQDWTRTWWWLYENGLLGSLKQHYCLEREVFGFENEKKLLLDGQRHGGIILLQYSIRHRRSKHCYPK